MKIHASDSVAQGAGLFWLGALIYCALCVAAVVWFAQADLAYIKLYRTVRGVDLVPPRGRYLKEPWRWPAESIAFSLRGFRTFWQRQPEPELEAARRRLVHRWWLIVVVTVLGTPIPLVFSAFGH